MLSKLKKNNKGGFTIIEVMIVLAIAGLIMLIVFLAVPALQRSARNTQRKNEAAQVAAAVASYISNNGGSLPGAVAADANAGVVDLCGANCSAGNKETAKLGYYSNANFSIISSASPVYPDTEHIVIDKGYTCDTTNTSVGPVSARSAVILYATETGSGNAVQCVEQ